MSRMDLAEVEEMVEHLTEEAGEIVCAAMKAARHGFDSYHPDRPNVTNKSDLEKEIGHLIAIKERLVSMGVLDDDKIEEHFNRKREVIQRGKWHHHQ